MQAKTNITIEVFFELVRAGLWEQGIRLADYGQIDYPALQELAEEQAVVGLIAAGMEHVTDIKIPKQDLLQFIGQTLQIEEQNKAMNYFIGVLVDKMREAGIYTLLVKGQGVAQCYERPLWRSSGDVDFYLSDTNYLAAKEFLTPLAAHVDEEDKQRSHYSMTIDPWIVELHGTLYSGFSRRIDRGLDEVHKDIFYGGNVRSWMDENVQVFLPSANNDVIIIFTHIIQHFYVGGIGLRQICDWCRLLWTYRDSLNNGLLESRIRKMGLMTEWKAFASLAVERLGMPEEAMPFYKSSKEYRRKSRRILDLIIHTGTFGHNQDQSYRTKYPTLVQKTITLWHRIGEFYKLTMIFPCNAPKFFVSYVFNRVKVSL